MRIAVLKLLPDGSKRVRIHYFVRDEVGPITDSGGQVNEALREVTKASSTGYIACSPRQQSVLPQKKGGEYFLTPHSDDPRAVTCPECMETEEYKTMMATYDEITEEAARQTAPVTQEKAAGAGWRRKPDGSVVE
jgi:hypothetical protein